MNVASVLSSGHILKIEHQLRCQAGQAGTFRWKRKKSMMVFWRKMRRREEKWKSRECSSLLQKHGCQHGRVVNGGGDKRQCNDSMER